jgi:hypothetical protein
MKQKNFTSLSVALSFTALAITGLLLFTGAKTKTTENIHEIFGVIFIGWAFTHIINNWSSITSYMKVRTGVSVSKELVIALIVTLIFLAGTGFNIPPFPAIANIGKGLFRKEGGNRVPKLTFDLISTKQEATATALNVIVQKSGGAPLATVAIWTEDSTHHVIDNLFVPAYTLALKDNEENIQEAIREGELEKKPFSASEFSSYKTTSTELKPNYDNATPSGNFILSTKTSAQKNFFVILEIQNAGKTEHYEAMVDTSREKAFTLKSSNGELITQGIVEIK